MKRLLFRWEMILKYPEHKMEPILLLACARVSWHKITWQINTINGIPIKINRSIRSLNGKGGRYIIETCFAQCYVGVNELLHIILHGFLIKTTTIHLKDLCQKSVAERIHLIGNIEIILQTILFTIRIV